MTNKPFVIDLEAYRTPGAKVFTSRPRGKEVREKSKINSVEESHDNVIIKIPEDISSINPSFLEEFLEPVVIKLGEKGFMTKFKFENPGRYKIDLDLSEAIERILREESAIAE